LAFPVDGLPENVIEHRTGWLADGVSASGLEITLARALDELEGGQDLRHRCREFAEQNYGSLDVARKYEMVFRHMITGGDANSLSL
jgi:glycosyltransferase involved in cell wall biosynthesis